VRVWIDATQPHCNLLVFGMSLLERQLRGLLQAGLKATEICVELPSGAAAPPPLPADLLDALALRWCSDGLSLDARLQRALDEADGDPLLALSADTVIDSRLLSHLAQVKGSVAFIGGEGGECGAVLRLEQGLPRFEETPGDLLAIARGALGAGVAKPFSEGDFDGYIYGLRRQLPAYLFRIDGPDTRDRIERWLFWSNYKGSTDFMTKHVYPPAVWLLVRPLARWRVHPNWVTAVDIAAAVAAIPFFMLGQWVPGLVLAYLMSVLDSVDGKLARLTYTASKLGDYLDHGLDILHPPFWYMAWAWGLTGGDTSSGLFQASLWLLGIYVLDRLLVPLFRWRTERSIHAYTPFDVKMRTFISRRNVNLVLFTVALAVDAIVGGQTLAGFALYFVVLWQAASFLFHAERVARFWNALR
jgi:phosphatidylglycerophosphate synthase